MATKQSKSRTSPRKRRSRSQSSSNGSRASSGSKRRYEKNLPDSGTMPEREYQDYSVLDPKDIEDAPDVLLDVPLLKIDEIHFELEDLQAQVQLRAEVLDLVKLGVGAEAQLGKVKLDIKGVEAQALLKVRLDHVTAIIDRVLTTLDRNPEIVKSLGKAVEQVGEGAGHAVGELGKGTGEAVEDVGEGAGEAVEDVGQGAGGAVQQVGKGASGALEGVGQAAGQAVGEVGKGAGQATQQVGQGAGQAAQEVGQGVGDALPDITDAAKKQLDDLGLDASSVKGTGADGRILVKDVKKAAEGAG